MTDDKAALEAEATNSTLRQFSCDGETYTVEGEVEEWDLQVMKAYEDGKMITVAEELLGPKQWAKFMAKRPKNKNFTELTEKMFAVIGVTEGESEG